MSLTPLEHLEEEARAEGIAVDDSILRAEDPLDGLCLQRAGQAPVILVNRRRPARVRHVALAEELGHCHKSTGDIAAQSTVAQRKSENLGRAWAYEKLAPPETIRSYLRKGYFSFQEIAEELDVTPDFLLEAMDYYQRKGIVLNTAAQDEDAGQVVILARNTGRLTPAQYARLRDALLASAPRVFQSSENP